MVPLLLLSNATRLEPAKQTGGPVGEEVGLVVGEEVGLVIVIVIVL